MSCPPFQIRINGDANEAFRKASQKANSEGAVLQGDTKSGSFIGFGVQGTYKVEGQIVTIYVTKKPIYLTCGMIKSELEKFFE